MKNWIPVIDRIFPTAESIMASLLPLSLEELRALIDIPNPNELSAAAAQKLPLANGKPAVPKGKLLAPEPTKLEAAKNWAKQYHEKIQDFVREAEEIERKIAEAEQADGKTTPDAGIVAQAAASTTQKKKNAAALRALNGVDFTANETGPVQRVRLDRNGTTWDAMEKIEKKVTAGTGGSQNKKDVANPQHG